MVFVAAIILIFSTSQESEWAYQKGIRQRPGGAPLLPWKISWCVFVWGLGIQIRSRSGWSAGGDDAASNPNYSRCWIWCGRYCGSFYAAAFLVFSSSFLISTAHKWTPFRRIHTHLLSQLTALITTDTRISHTKGYTHNILFNMQIPIGIWVYYGDENTKKYVRTPREMNEKCCCFQFPRTIYLAYLYHGNKCE